MRLVLDFGTIPSPRRPDHAHRRLTAGMNVDMLHRHLLLAFAAVAIEGQKNQVQGQRPSPFWPPARLRYGDADRSSRAGSKVISLNQFDRSPSFLWPLWLWPRLDDLT
jgi:hypothetical protein